jgi:D-glycero-alpha-D-manno-heptose-7-phosphate kinase
LRVARRNVGRVARLGLAGGGTDLSPYCDEYGGAVLNATIDRFAYAHVFRNPAGELLFRAPDVDEEERLAPSADLPLDQGLVLRRAVYAHVIKSYCDGIPIPLTVSTATDVPAGSGLGASSALVVALVEAFRSALQLPLGPYDVARLAFDIERTDLALAGGRQDQYAAAFGGLNYMEFLPQERVIVNPLRIRRDYLNEFESSLVIAFTGQSRRSDTIIKEQVSGLSMQNAATVANMHELKRDAIEMKLA